LKDDSVYKGLSEVGHPEPNPTIRERSDNVSSTNRFTLFFYLLMRDHLTPGRVESIMRDILKPGTIFDFSNGWLANYACDIVERLELKVESKKEG
jgi:hypothetical protein